MTVRIPVPGLGRTVAAGDLVRAVTEYVGIRPCGGCERRRMWLNDRIQFVPADWRGGDRPVGTANWED